MTRRRRLVVLGLAAALADIGCLAAAERATAQRMVLQSEKDPYDAAPARRPGL